MVFQRCGVQFRDGIGFRHIASHFHLVDLRQGTLFQCPRKRLRLLFSNVICRVPCVARALGPVEFVYRAAYPISAQQRFVELLLARKKIATRKQQCDTAEKQPEMQTISDFLENMVCLFVSFYPIIPCL